MTPLKPSPGDLPWFLAYAEEHRVPGAIGYRSPLQWKKYGPDILSYLINEALTSLDVGIPHGDVIRLKDVSAT